MHRSSFIVGSQVEGTTSKGIKSNTDRVLSHEHIQVVPKLGAWKTGKINLLTFKDETTPPQFYKQCRLQPSPDGRQEYRKDPVKDTDVVGEQGRVLVFTRFLIMK